MSVLIQVEKYLSQERTIILAVVPANQDVATVDILERAKRVDPEGNRLAVHIRVIVARLHPSGAYVLIPISHRRSPAVSRGHHKARLCVCVLRAGHSAC